jgi:putative membrane protein
MRRVLIALTTAVALLGLMGSTAGATTAHGPGYGSGYGYGHHHRNDHHWRGWDRGSAATAEDVAFLNAAWQINLLEVFAGSIAEREASNPLVAELGDRVVHDHFVLLLKQARVMQQAGVPFPAGLDAGAQAKLADLRAAGDLDTAFLEMQVGGHMMAIAVFQNEASSTGSWAVKRFAKDSLRTLNEHLWMAQLVSAWFAQQPAAVA